MSMHFVPQWVKPIKPTGGSQATTPSALNGSGSGNGDLPSPSIAKSTQPFPALGGGARGSPTTSTAPNPGLSYSRAAYTPQSPNVADTSYFPDQEVNPGNPHPFRYSRDQILGLYDENKFKEVPIELLELLDQTGILVSKQPVKPVGLRELTETEKKLLSTSVHPTIPTRNRNNLASNTENNPTPTRRTNAGGKDPMSNGARIGRFGQGESNAFGIGKIGTIGATGQDGRAPGAIGGGFGGVAKRMGMGRRQESTDERTSTWRPTRTNSGNFEGVLGFGGGGAVGGPGAIGSVAASAAPAIAEDAPASTGPVGAPTGGGGAEKKDIFGNGGGPGWGNGQKKWRLAAAQTEEEKTLTVPNAADHKPLESLAATPSATPVPERDADVASVAPPSETPAPQASQQQEQQQQQQKEDLGAIEWFYRDPAGQEQGPFIATQMHEWFSHAYFQDDLPLRRAHESTFHTLGELKTATNSQVQPFLTAVRPRLPPNLPIPSRAPSGQGPISPAPGPNGFPVDAFRNMSLQQPGMHAFANPNQPFSPAAGGQFMQSPGFGSPVASLHQNQVPQLHPHQHQQLQHQAHQSWGPGPMTPGSQMPFRSGAVDSPIRSPFGPVPGEPFGNIFPAGPFSPAPGAPAGGMPFGGQANGWFANQGFRPPQPQQLQQQHQMQMSEQGQGMGMGGDPFQSAPIEQPQQYQQQQQQQQQQAPEPVQQASPVKQQQQPAPQEPSPVQAPVELEPEVVDAQPEAVPEPVTPAPTNAWGNVAKTSQPPSRKASVAAPAPQNIPSPKKATTSLARSPSPAPYVEPTPASAPTQAPVRPASPPAPKVDKPAPITLSNVIDKAISSPSSANSAAPKAAPWANKDEKEKAGPSLRQIQEAEAKQAEARRAARAAAALQAQQIAALTGSSTEDLPSSMAWGLPSSGSGKASTSAAQSPSVTAPPAAVWGSGDAAPKKTLKQIQEEEEKRKKALHAKAVAAAAASAPTSNGAPAVAKRGYADLAAAPAATPVPGWSTVGAGGKAIPGAAPKTGTTAPSAAIRATSSAIPAGRPTSAAGVARTTASSASLDDTYTPSLEFIKWAKNALTGLRTPIEDFLQICLSFPIEPAAAEKAQASEIMSEIVYANSGMLDGRRFASDFFEKRKADAKKQAQTQAAAKLGGGGWTVTGSASAQGTNLADVVKSVKSQKEDTGFKVVKAKGKKK